MEMLPKLKRLDQTFETMYQKNDSSGMVLIISHYWFHSWEVLTCSFSHFKRAEMVWNSLKVKSFLAFILKSCRNQKQMKNLEMQENLTQEQYLFSISQH